MTDSPERQLIPLTDGRVIDVVTYGPADGLPLVLHHGTPGGGLVTYPPYAEIEAQRGLRSIELARPGYQGSTPHPGRRVADVAADVAQILDALGAGEFVTAGWSGGGPHVMACAALLPGRCLSAATLAGVAPVNAEGLDWLAGMGQENLDEFGAAGQGPAALTAYLEKEAAGLGDITGADIIAGLGDLIDNADKAVLTGAFADAQAASIRAALAAGITGWLEDDLAFVQDWGFPLPGTAGPAAPVASWQGDQDRMVPFSHGQWFEKNVPGLQAHLVPGAGHISLKADHYGEILDDLLARAGR